MDRDPEIDRLRGESVDHDRFGRPHNTLINRAINASRSDYELKELGEKRNREGKPAWQLCQEMIRRAREAEEYYY